MALVECLGPNGLGLLPSSAVGEAMTLLEDMARERQQAINADHPIVQEFWEAFDHVENAAGFPVLNHYRPDHKEIAINLKHFEQVTAEKKLRVPTTTELKRHLKASKVRKFVESNRAVRSTIHDGRTVKCWVFERES